MNLLELRQAFRKETQDLQAPYAWSDEEIDRHLNEAEDDAARRSGLLVDSTSVAAEYDIAAGDEAIELHPSVIYIRRVRPIGGTPWVPRVVRSMDEEIPGWEDTAASETRVFIPDWESGKLRLWPPSARALTVKATVVRTPLRPMASDLDTPELPLRTHYSLVYGAMQRAYLKKDTDFFDPKASERAGAAFTAEFGPPVSALDEHWAIEQYYDVGHR